MRSSRSLLMTTNLHDYALAISAHRQLAKTRGVHRFYPFLLSPDQAALLKPLLRYYGLAQVDFSSLFDDEDTATRSQEIARALFAEASAPILVSLSASTNQLAGSVYASLIEKRPLVFSDSSLSLGDGIDQEKTISRSDHVIVANSQSQLSLAAAFYAHATDKQFYLMDDLDHLESALHHREVSSVILVDDFRTFTKGFLDQLLEWSLASRPRPVQLGILTAYSVNEFSALIGRLLIHRDFHLSGQRSKEPEGLSRLPLKKMKPTEYYIIKQHGNEMHMHHGDNEVICGAFPSAFKPAKLGGFNCEVNCPYEGRVRSNEIPAHNVVILSCNTLTLGDGLVPPEFTLLLNFLNGWSTSVLSPFKHVQVNSGMSIFADALIRSGYSLGEISVLLNSVSQFGTLPDYGYVLVGDPEVVPSGNGRATSASFVTADDVGLNVECSPNGARVMECLISEETIAKVMTNGHPVALDPVSAELCNPDVFFAFRKLKPSRELGVILFSTQPLPDAALRFRLHPANRVRDTYKRQVLAQVKKISELSIYGIDKSVLQTAKDRVLQPLRDLSAYPRPVELSLANVTARNFWPFMDTELWRARRLVIESMLTTLAEKRLWLSQQYASVYPLQYRIPVDERNPPCVACQSNTYTWRFEDNCTDLPPREMMICARCGIISDTPAATELEITLQPFQELDGDRHEQKVLIRNLSDRRIETSFFMQFNQWKKVGSSVEPLIHEAVLEPHETVERTAQFSFDAPLPNDILEIHGCFLTDTFDLYCVTQRGISSQGGAYRT